MTAPETMYCGKCASLNLGNFACLRFCVWLEFTRRVFPSKSANGLWVEKCPECLKSERGRAKT